MENKNLAKRLKKRVIFIGLFYLLQGIVYSTLVIVELIKYKTGTASQGLPYNEDTEIVTTLSVLLSISLALVLTSPLLLWGALKETYFYFVPWLFICVICVIISCVFLFATIIKSFFNLEDPNFKLGNLIFIVITMAFGLTLHIICYRIVFKLYKQTIRPRENSSKVLTVCDEPTINQTLRFVVFEKR